MWLSGDQRGYGVIHLFVGCEWIAYLLRGNSCCHDDWLCSDCTIAGVHCSQRRPRSKLSWKKPNRLRCLDEYGRQLKILMVQDDVGPAEDETLDGLNNVSFSGLDSTGYVENIREDRENGAKHIIVKLRNMIYINCTFNSVSCKDSVMGNPCLPPVESIGSKLPCHVIGDVLEVYEFVQRFYDILGFQETPSFSFKELEEELTCSGVDLNATEEVNNKVSAQGLVKSNDTLLSDIHIKFLTLLMHEMQLPKRKKGTGHVLSAKGCQLHVLVNKLTWPELARRYVLGLLSIKRSFSPVEVNEADKSKVFRCLQGDGRVLCGSTTGVEGIEEDAKVLVEALETVFGSFDTENNLQHVLSDSSGTTDASDKAMLVDDDNLGWSQELEPVRKLRTNVGSRIRDCIRKALDKGPPLWAREILEHSISKGFYKSNASGPTKKCVISVLDKLCSKDLNQQPDKRRNNRNSLLQSKVIMMRCHFALRRSLADDRKKVFCNLLSVQLLKFVENAEEGILDSPVKVSHPLDFRTIDVRLEAGAYGTSYDAFLDDVRQVWANLRVVYANKPELVKLADELSDKFELYYENEVKSLFQKYGEYVDSDYTRLKKEIDDMLTSSRELPKSPWKQNSCKVCGINKDNKLVILCDGCDAEYHTYCLKLPLKAVPRGYWFCHRCVETNKESLETTDAMLLANHENLCDNEDAPLPANPEDLCDNEDATLLANPEDLCDNEDAPPPANLEDLCENADALPPAYLEDLCDNDDSLIPANLEDLCENDDALLPAHLDDLCIDDLCDNDDALFSANLEDLCENNDALFPPHLDDMSENDDALFPPYLDVMCDALLPANLEVSFDNDDAMLPANHEEFCDNDYAMLPANHVELCDNDVVMLPANHEDLCDKDDALLPANLENLGDNDVIKGLEPLAAALTQKEYCEWGLDERVFLLKFLCDEVLNSSTIRRHLEESIDLRRKCLGVDSSGRVYWILSEPNRLPPFLVVDQIPEGFQMAKNSNEENLNCKCSVSFPWVSYGSENDIEEMSGWLDELDDRERLLKESILNWKRNLDALKSENQGINVMYEKRDNFLGTKAASLLSAKCAPPYESGNEKVKMGMEPSSSIACEEQNKPLLGKSDIFLKQLKMDLLDIEAALPEGARIPSKSHMERRRVWRSFVKSSDTILKTIQAVIVLEDMIKTKYLKNWWYHWSSLWVAVKTPTLSALAMRIYSLDAAIEYEKKPEPVNLRPNRKKGNKRILEI